MWLTRFEEAGAPACHRSARLRVAQYAGLEHDHATRKLKYWNECPFRKGALNGITSLFLSSIVIDSPRSINTGPERVEGRSSS